MTFLFPFCYIYFMSNFKFSYIFKVIFCIINFSFIFYYLLKFTNGSDYLEMSVINGFIGYGLLLFYFIFFKKLYKNLFLFLFSNFLNILAVIIIFDLIMSEFFQAENNLSRFYFFTVFKLFPFFISVIITEFLFSKILNIKYPDKLLYFLRNNSFRILSLLNTGSLFFYTVFVFIGYIAKGLID